MSAVSAGFEGRVAVQPAEGDVEWTEWALARGAWMEGPVLVVQFVAWATCDGVTPTMEWRFTGHEECSQRPFAEPIEPVMAGDRVTTTLSLTLFRAE